MEDKGEIIPGGDFTLTFDHLIDNYYLFYNGLFQGSGQRTYHTKYLVRQNMIRVHTPVTIRNAAIVHG